MKQLGETLAVIAVVLAFCAIVAPKELGATIGTIVAAYHHAETQP